MFRSLRRADGENYKMFKNRLKDVFKHYIESKEITDLDSLADCMLTEQFLNMMPVETKQFITSRQPNDSEEASQLADLFDEMSRNTGKSVGSAQSAKEGNPSQTGKQNLPAQNGTSGGNKHPNGWGNSKQNGKRTINCWGCNATDHKYSLCPKRAMANPAVGNAVVCYYCKCFHPPNVACHFQPPGAVYSTAIAADANLVHQGNFNPYIIPVTVNGVNTMAIRDTGNMTPSLVDPSLVCDHDYTGKSVFLKGAFDGPGVRREVPLAIVRLSSDALKCNNDVSIEVGVCIMPPGLLCNIGNSLFRQHPQFTDILGFGGGDRAKTFSLNVGPQHQNIAGEETRQAAAAVTVTAEQTRRQDVAQAQQTQLPRETLDIPRQGAFESPTDRVIDMLTETDLEGGGDLNGDRQETECKQRIALQADSAGDSDQDAVNVVCRQTMTEIYEASQQQQTEQRQSNMARTELMNFDRAVSEDLTEHTPLDNDLVIMDSRQDTGDEVSTLTGSNGEQTELISTADHDVTAASSSEPISRLVR